MAPYREQLSGSVDLGMMMSSGPLDLPAALGRFHARYPLVSVRLRQSVGVRRQTDDAFAAAGIEPDTPYEVADYDTAAGLVRNRLGIVVMPATPAGRYADLHAARVTPAITWGLALATPARFPVSPAAMALADAILAEHNPDQEPNR